MSKELNFNPISTVNSSGFPLQIRIANVANLSEKWKVFAEEHPWYLSKGESGGFIDLILMNHYRVQTMVIECKRVKQAGWVFLIPQTSPSERSQARLWVSSKEYSKWDMFGWSHLTVEPTCYESKYCAIHGQSNGRNILLERIASELIDSIEALAFQEKELTEKDTNNKSTFRRIYIPVIVTTAQIQVAVFNPSEVSLSDGTLPKDVDFSTVPFVRFRKALTSRFESTSQSSLPEASRDTERTVFVVNAESFGDFLSACEANLIKH